MKTLKTVYADSSLSIRLRAPVFQIIIMILFVASLLIVFGDILTGEPLNEIGPHSLLSLVTLATWILLRMGKFRIVSDVYFSLIELGMLLLRLLDGYKGPQTLPLFAAILGSFLVFASVFLDSRGVLFGLVGCYFVSFFGYAVWVISSGIRGAEGGSLVEEFLYPGVAVTVISFGLVAIRLIFDRVLADSETSLLISKRMAEQTRTIASDSAVQLAKAGDLLDNSTETAQASEEIEANMRQIEERITGLDDRIKHADTTVGEIRNVASSLSRLSEKQARQVNESGAAVEEMAGSIANVSRIIMERNRNVHDLTAQATEAGKTMERSIDAFKRVSDALEGIGDAAAVIEDISDRTNLLAMNAAIQAAHAGDAGRGFAVVAGEIRSLAESSSLSARSIAETMTGLTESITSAGETIGASGKAYRDIIGGIGTVSSGIDEIATNASELESGTREILSATGALKSMADQVDQEIGALNNSQDSFAGDISSIRDISREITTGVTEIASGLSLIKDSMEGVKTSATDLMEKSINLNRALEKKQG